MKLLNPNPFAAETPNVNYHISLSRANLEALLAALDSYTLGGPAPILRKRISDDPTLDGLSITVTADEDEAHYDSAKDVLMARARMQGFPF